MEREFAIVGNLLVTFGIVFAHIAVILILNGLENWPVTFAGAAAGAVIANLILYVLFRRRRSQEELAEVGASNVATRDLSVEKRLAHSSGISSPKPDRSDGVRYPFFGIACPGRRQYSSSGTPGSVPTKHSSHGTDVDAILKCCPNGLLPPACRMTLSPAASAIELIFRTVLIPPTQLISG